MGLPTPPGDASVRLPLGPGIMNLPGRSAGGDASLVRGSDGSLSNTSSLGNAVSDLPVSSLAIFLSICSRKKAYISLSEICGHAAVRGGGKNCQPGRRVGLFMRCWRALLNRCWIQRARDSDDCLGIPAEKSSLLCELLGFVPPPAPETFARS
eukprot:scaffold803_cov310-Pinguiococcus_pyrenoidosus.AAC.87